MPEEKRTLLVFGEKTFKIRVPMNAKITFGPFSPPPKGGYGAGRGIPVGTLRVYDKAQDRCIAVFSNITGYRDMSMEYEEEVAREEGAIIWKSDEKGYTREEKVSRQKEWVETPALPTPNEEVPF